ncbi:unnamed protein product, partial [Urochloa humidicola]
NPSRHRKVTVLISALRSSRPLLSSPPPSSGLNPPHGFKMYLQYYINEKGDKVYTTKKESPLGVPTQSAHPVASLIQWYIATSISFQVRSWGIFSG